MRNMRNRFLTLLFLLICVPGFFTVKTIELRAQSRQQAERKLYHEMETEYLKGTKEILSEAGYKNSGVNMTKIIDEEGRRTYTVRIHNRRIDALKDAEKEELMNELRSVCFADGQCEFKHEFFSVGE